jgi:dynein heavy chain, axonemal
VALRVRDNVHLVLAMSPIGDALRNRMRMYPALVSCTTIDWLQQWPADALVEVANKFLADVRLDDAGYRPKIAAIFSGMHTSVIDASGRMLEEVRARRFALALLTV